MHFSSLLAFHVVRVSVLLLLMFPNVLYSQVYDYKDEASSQVFRAYISPFYPVIKGTYYYINGWGGDTRGIATLEEKEGYRIFCAQNSLTCMGGLIYSCEEDEVFQDALNYFAAVSHRPEIADGPIILDGFSGGGDFVTCFGFSKIPEKTMAIIAQAGGVFASMDEDEVVSKIAALFYIGDMDSPSIRFYMRDTFYKYRAMNAPWTFVVGSNLAHGRLPRQFRFDYIEAIMEHRLLDESSDEMSDIDMTKGFLGDIATYDYFSYNSYPFNKDSANWFPDETCARNWQTVADPDYPTTILSLNMKEEINMLVHHLSGDELGFELFFDKPLDDHEFNVILYTLAGTKIEEKSVDILNNYAWFTFRHHIPSRNIIIVQFIFGDKYYTEKIHT